MNFIYKNTTILDSASKLDLKGAGVGNSAYMKVKGYNTRLVIKVLRYPVATNPREHVIAQSSQGFFFRDPNHVESKE